ncbi:MAG: T9SS type A sorting domain-containing protein [Bacteroidetes bacterium]|nr:T9SS type A sorting domain-containing protein [Bacteroidota bacterium]
MSIDNEDRVYITGSLFQGYGGTLNLTKFGKFHLSTESRSVTFYLARLIDDGTLGVEDSQNKNSLKVFPNPTRNHLNIEFNQIKPSDKIEMRLLGLSGNIIYSEVISGFEGPVSRAIALGNISRGIYFIEIRSGEERTIQKVVVN